MRNLKLWLKAVPELVDYPYITLNNKQRPWISKNNIPDNKFNSIFNKE